jgi:hypothetical protein
MRTSQPAPQIPRSRMAGAVPPFIALSLVPILFVLSGCASAPTAPLASPTSSQSIEAATPTEGEAEPAESTEPATEPAQDSATGAESEPAAEPAEGSEAEAAEPEREWLVDEQGRSYYVETLAKDHLKVWRYLGDNQVRIPWGQTLDLVNEDDDYFYYKRYNVADIRARKVHQPPTEEELAAVADRYRVDLRERDRLSLVPAGDGLPEQGQWRNGFVLADMNEDGHLDIVHGPQRKLPGPPRIFLGDSRGHWKLWQEAVFPRIQFDYGDVAVADFNRDGHPDLAVTSHLRGAAVLVGDGEGHFETWSDGIGFLRLREQRPVFTSRTMEAVDWNGDGWKDLVLVGEGPRLAVARPGDHAEFSSGSFGALVYLNQKDGTWKMVRQATRFGDVYGDSVTVGDFNGDGRIDFATGSNVMGSKEILDLGRDDGLWDRVAIDSLRNHAYVRAVRAADFDGDKRDDLAVAYMSYELGVWRSGIDLMLSRPGGEWERQPVAVEESRDGIYALDTGDLDGDGAVDLVALTGKGAVWVLLGDGHGGFVQEASPEVPPQEGGCRGYHVALVDIDDDGQDEMIAGFAGEGTIQQMDECPSGGSLRVWDVEKGGTTQASIEK